jgi:two-component system chemotaxis sensor kinase CheA
MDELEKELKQGFLVEAFELLESTEQAFLQLEKNRNDLDLLNKIFRFAHNLKGTSRAVGFGEVAEFTHELENLILKIKEGKIEVTDHIVTLLLECNDHVSKMIHGLQENLEAHFDSGGLIEKIQAAVRGESHTELTEVALPVVHEEVHHAVESHEAPAMSSAALESLKELGIDINNAEFQQITEPSKPEVTVVPIKEKIVESKTTQEVATASSQAQKANTEETLRVAVGKVNKLNDIVGELVIVQTVLAQMRYSLIQDPLAVKTITQLGKLSKEIQDMTMGLSLVPIKSTFQKMTRIVRDTSKALDKKVELIIQGEETEIDKTVLEHIGDPLVHIVRNAVDHGLESTESRVKAKKSEVGKITLSAYHQGNNLVIEVVDDGKGIDAQIIKKKAIEKGVIQPNANLSENELINLIFHPGFSTKDQVSEVSGRGVGMDVVKNNITRLSGTVDIQTKVGLGSTFKIFLPLTLAIIDGMIVKVGEQFFVIPLDQIAETLSIKEESLSNFTGIGTCMNLRGEIYPLMKISQKLSIHTKDPDKLENKIAMIVRKQEVQYAIVVDDIIRQQQIVIKKIGQELNSQKGFMGSTILGDGRPAFILDLKELFGKTTGANHKTSRLAA